MKHVKELLAAMLGAALVMTLTVALTVGAADTASVSATVDNASVIANDVLAKLIDGDAAADATAASDKMVTITSTDATKPATAVITVDLGEVKTTSGVALSIFADADNGIVAPSVKVELSEDGKDFYGITAEKPVTVNPTGAQTVTVKTDATRMVTKAQYVKLTVTFTGTSAALTEVALQDPAAGCAVTALNEAFAYTEHLGSDPGIAILDHTDLTMDDGNKDDGKIDLSYVTPEDKRADGALYLKSSQLIKAAYDETTGAYKIMYSKVNPWPAGHTGLEELAEGEILLSIVTSGNVNAGSEAQTRCSAAKWIARGLVEGDYVWLDTEAKTLTFYPAAHTFPEKPAESSEPTVSSESSESASSTEEATSSDVATSSTEEATSSDGTASAAANTSSAASQTPQPGDAGVIIFVVIAAIAVTGMAVALKCRR